MKEELNNLNLHNCEFKVIDEDTYEYRWGVVWVKILKNSDNEWCYEPLGNPHYCSKGFQDLQHCIDDAFEAMLSSKL